MAVQRPEGGHHGFAHRLIVPIPGSVTRAQSRFEHLVPSADPVAFSAARSHQQRLLVAQALTPHGFMRYCRAELPLNPSDPSLPAGVEYLMGNYAVTAAALAQDPSAALWANLRTVIYSDTAGAAHLAVDQPSANLRLANTELVALAQRLDAYLAHLIVLLHARAPKPLRISAGDFYDIRHTPPPENADMPPAVTNLGRLRHV